MTESEQTPYEKFLAAKKAYAEEHKSMVREVLAAHVTDMQHILWMKSVCEMLEDGDKARTFRHPDDTFGFTEILVNRLMHFAYLKGTRAVDEKSFRAGWDACREEAVKAVEKL